MIQEDFGLITYSESAGKISLLLSLVSAYHADAILSFLCSTSLRDIRMENNYILNRASLTMCASNDKCSDIRTLSPVAIATMLSELVWHDNIHVSGSCDCTKSFPVWCLLRRVGNPEHNACHVFRRFAIILKLTPL